MLFDLISDAKVYIILIIPNKNLLFFEKFIFLMAFFAKNLLRLSENSDREKEIKITDAPYFVKIPVRLKISVDLKISVRSENPYLKISVRWANSPERCKCSGVLQRIAGSTGESRNTRPPKESRRATKGKQAGKRETKNFFAYI